MRQIEWHTQSTAPCSRAHFQNHHKIAYLGWYSMQFETKTLLCCNHGPKKRIKHYFIFRLWITNWTEHTDAKWSWTNSSLKVIKRSMLWCCNLNIPGPILPTTANHHPPSLQGARGWLQPYSYNNLHLFAIRMNFKETREGRSSKKFLNKLFMIEH